MYKNNQKNAFSLLELVFVIIILTIIASIAIPKLMVTKNDALIASIKSDIKTSINTVPSYYLVKGEIKDIKDAISLDITRWNKTSNINNTKNLAFVFKTINDTECLRMEIDDTNNIVFRVLIVDKATNSDNFCEKLRDSYNIKNNNETIDTINGLYTKIVNIRLD